MNLPEEDGETPSPSTGFLTNRRKNRDYSRGGGKRLGDNGGNGDDVMSSAVYLKALHAYPFKKPGGRA